MIAYQKAVTLREFIEKLEKTVPCVCIVSDIPGINSIIVCLACFFANLLDILGIHMTHDSFLVGDSSRA